MKNINFIVCGEPKAKARPRFTRNGRAYTPKETADYEKLVRQVYFDKHGSKTLNGELEATIVAYFSVPTSASKTAQSAMLSDEKRPCKKPDCDNIAKIILDALNGYAYADDKQIIDLRVIKKYAEVPKVVIEISERCDHKEDYEHK
ncbi:RusA family crossover junction endodeoxyribonuclease [Bacteroides heparinolyticus]|uniref:RusA family crossover junction endodeoxyribonuclease n=1 Tax=Prevotella heparinolytica TaxID=28113 RepID=UPI0035A0EFAB